MSTPATTTFPLSAILSRARADCPFYQRLYADVRSDAGLTDLPIIDASAYWQAHNSDRREVLTGPLVDGVVLNSGGTTGAPKYVYFNNEEWDSAIAMSALACEGTGLETGDSVANLFASANLAASLIFSTMSLQAMRVGVMQFPIGYLAQHFDAADEIIRRFGINTLAGFPTRLLQLIDHMDRKDAPRVQMRRILFAGELFSEDQEAHLKDHFPGVSIRSLGYASVDSGIVAYADATCGLGEHRPYNGATVVEILPEDSDTPTEEIGQPGRIVFTSLTRRLMPMLRYPTGDLGQWVDAPGTPNRRFLLLGRAGDIARVASFNVSAAVVAGLLDPFREALGIREFQLLVTRENLRDQLTVRVVASATPEALAAATANILRGFDEKHRLLGEAAAAGVSHPTRIEWIGREDLIVAERTGKLRVIVDRRAG